MLNDWVIFVTNPCVALSRDSQALRSIDRSNNVDGSCQPGP